MTSEHETPSLEIADIFEKFSHLLKSMPPEHWKVVQAIKNCRTSALGRHLLKCGSCDFKKMLITPAVIDIALSVGLPNVISGLRKGVKSF